MQSQESPAAANGFEKIIPFIGFLFQLGGNILQAAAGFFFFRICHGDTVDRPDIQDAGFFRFRPGNIIFRSYGNCFTAGIHNLLPERIGNNGKAHLIRQETECGENLRKDSTESTADTGKIITQLLRTVLPADQTAEEPAAGITRKGAQGTLAVTGRGKGREKIRQQPGGSMHKSSKRFRFLPKGLKGQNAGKRDCMKTRRRYFGSCKKAGQAPGKNSVKQANRFR